MLEHLQQLLIAELEAVEQIQGVLGAEVIAGLGVLALVGLEAAQIAHLELGAIGAGLLCQIDQALGQGQVAIVVVADLGDDEGRGTGR